MWPGHGSIQRPYAPKVWHVCCRDRVNVSKRQESKVMNRTDGLSCGAISQVGTSDMASAPASCPCSLPTTRDKLLPSFLPSPHRRINRLIAAGILGTSEPILCFSILILRCIVLKAALGP